MMRSQIMKIDILHALANYLMMYDSSAKMLFREALDNALDIGSTMISIRFGKTGGRYWISFEDNGAGMDKAIFDIYLQIAKSTKTVGKSIGFAGIGAKVYLAVGEFVEIFTETCNGKESWKSTMFRKQREVHNEIPTKSSRKKRGTFYKVNVNHIDYMMFQQQLDEWCARYYNEALLKGIKINDIVLYFIVSHYHSLKNS